MTLEKLDNDQLHKLFKLDDIKKKESVHMENLRKLHEQYRDTNKLSKKS